MGSDYGKDFLTKVEQREAVEIEGTKFEVRQLRADTLLRFLGSMEDMGVEIGKGDDAQVSKIDFTKIPIDLLADMVSQSVFEPGGEEPLFSVEQVKRFPLVTLTDFLGTTLSLSRMGKEEEDDLKDG